MLKLKRLNRRGTQVECVIKVEDINGVSEIEIENEPLYDGDGNQVDEKVNENVYEIYFVTGSKIVVDKATYDKLLTKLDIEELA